MKMRWMLVAAAGMGAGLGWGQAGWGCGPFFPTEMIGQTDEELKAAPDGDFAVEVRRLFQGQSEWRAVVPKEIKRDYMDWERSDLAIYGPAQTAEGDEADLRAALGAQKVSGGEIDQAVSQLRKVRWKIFGFSEQWSRWRDNAWQTDREPEPQFVAPEVEKTLSGLPAEFREYEQGAVAYHAGKLVEAREIWTNLLTRPKDERKYRTTWATYMIGRTYSKSDPAKAIEYFQLTRKLVKEGWVDTLGLAVASLGWEAAAEMVLGHEERAIALYMEQAQTGDLLAMASLKRAARATLKKDLGVLTRVAKDKVARQVLTAGALTYPFDWRENADDPSKIRQSVRVRWLQAVEAAKVEEVAGADRLAWAAYQAGDMDATRRWLARFPKPNGITNWIQAKLAMREGKLDEAAKYLAQALPAFPENEVWPAATKEEMADPPFSPREEVRGELALLKLHRGQYTEALSLLLQAGYGSDAALVAERVLTPEELIAFVDAYVPPQKLRESPESSSFARGFLRDLLARRLMRLGRWKEARPYFDPAMQVKVDAYVAGIRAGHDSKLNSVERGRALWEAAKLARYSGMEMLGTTLGPDNGNYDGDFGGGDEGTYRIAAATQKSINAPSPDEITRIKASKIDIEKRWHYRYIAADHAWAAIALMPDNSDETARMCCEAGGWLKNQDPKAADRFYKTLVRRCGQTDLGREADRIRWFPKEKPKGAETQPGGK